MSFRIILLINVNYNFIHALCLSIIEYVMSLAFVVYMKEHLSRIQFKIKREILLGESSPHRVRFIKNPVLREMIFIPLN